jgi:hypothetical protein
MLGHTEYGHFYRLSDVPDASGEYVWEQLVNAHAQTRAWLARACTPEYIVLGSTLLEHYSLYSHFPSCTDSVMSLPS